MQMSTQQHTVSLVYLVAAGHWRHSKTWTKL